MQRDDVLTIPQELVRPQTNKKTKFVIGGVVIVLAVLYLIYTGIQSSSAYFLTIDELLARQNSLVGRQIRVSGMVDVPTIDYNSKDLILAFNITSPTGQRLPIVFNGPKPDQMSEGAEAIVEGKFDGTAFQAQTLLLKCPSRYQEGTNEIQVEAVK